MSLPSTSQSTAAYRGTPPEVSMSVRPRRGLVQAALIAAAAGFGSFELPARAQQLTNAPIDLQMFRPAMDSKGFITLNSSETLGQGDVSFGLVTTYARRPLTFTGTMTPQNVFRIDNIITPSLQFAVGLVKVGHLGLELGAVLPMSVMSGHGDPTD